MNRESIQKAIYELPVYKTVQEIESEIGMPRTTLQKYLKAGRQLPQKWVKPLEAYFCVPKSETAKPSEEKKKSSLEPKNKPRQPNNYLQQRMNLKNGIK